jgi:hypothetical protein
MGKVHIVIMGATALMLVACASNSGVVEGGDGNLEITAQAATGLGGLGNLKADVTKQAADYCGKQNKDFTVVNYSETKGPYILGKYPRVDLVFRCITRKPE